MASYEFHLMQLADSFFPSGMFGFSGGMESFFKKGHVRNAGDVAQFVRYQIKYQLLPCDVAVLIKVMKAASRKEISRAIDADHEYYAMKLVHEVRTSSVRAGRQMLKTIVHATNDRFAKTFSKAVEDMKSPGTYPACLAVAANAMKIPAKSAVRMMLYSYCVSVVGSAVRLGIISHVEAQVLLTTLARDVNSAKVGNRRELWQLAPMTEILQMQHELEESRMFIT